MMLFHGAETNFALLLLLCCCATLTLLPCPLAQAAPPPATEEGFPLPLVSFALSRHAASDGCSGSLCTIDRHPQHMVCSLYAVPRDVLLAHLARRGGENADSSTFAVVRTGHWQVIPSGIPEHSAPMTTQAEAPFLLVLEEMMLRRVNETSWACTLQRPTGTKLVRYPRRTADGRGRRAEDHSSVASYVEVDEEVFPLHLQYQHIELTCGFLPVAGPKATTYTSRSVEYNLTKARRFTSPLLKKTPHHVLRSDVSLSLTRPLWVRMGPTLAQRVSSSSSSSLLNQERDYGTQPGQNSLSRQQSSKEQEENAEKRGGGSDDEPSILETRMGCRLDFEITNVGTTDSHLRTVVLLLTALCFGAGMLSLILCPYYRKEVVHHRCLDQLDQLESWVQAKERQRAVALEQFAEGSAASATTAARKGVTDHLNGDDDDDDDDDARKRLDDREQSKQLWVELMQEQKQRGSVGSSTGPQSLLVEEEEGSQQQQQQGLSRLGPLLRRRRNRTNTKSDEETSNTYPIDGPR